MGTSSGARPSTSEGLKLLIIDLETTGLDPKQGSKPIEVAAALFSVKHRDILQTVSFLLPNDKNEAEHINRIKPAITKVDQPWRSAMDFFSPWPIKRIRRRLVAPWVQVVRNQPVT